AATETSESDPVNAWGARPTSEEPAVLATAAGAAIPRIARPDTVAAASRIGARPALTGPRTRSALRITVHFRSPPPGGAWRTPRAGSALRHWYATSRERRLSSCYSFARCGLGHSPAAAGGTAGTGPLRMTRLIA